MIVCTCNALTGHAIARAVEDGAASVAEVYAALDSPPQCGKCLPIVREMVGAAPPDPPPPVADQPMAGKREEG